MSVRKRSWTTKQGEAKEAWIVDYVDGKGERHIKTFARKGDAMAEHAKVVVDVAKGIHTPESSSLTVEGAAKQWLERCENEKLERSTLVQYRAHIAHIVPRIGAVRLAKLTTPQIHAFSDGLLRDLSRPLARKVLASFRAIIRHARKRGTIAHNVAEGVVIKAAKRADGKVQVGRDIPTADEIRRILDVVRGRWRPLLIVAAFTGLRASELRGLRWADIDLKSGTIHVRQHADAWGEIGRPKTHTSERDIPVGPHVVNTLKEWELASTSPKGEALVFPGKDGKPLTYSVIINSGYWAAQLAAGVVDAEGRPKYPGIHALRHFFASWCINRKLDGGLELPSKVVQERLGHSSIIMTSDVYGHLFPRGDDSEELAAAERALLSPVRSLSRRDIDAT
jgi:integrase